MKSRTASLVTTLFVLLAYSLLQPAWADQLADIKAAGKLRIAIINGLPSFSVTDTRAGLIGSDVDASKLLAKDMGVTPEFVMVANSDRLDALLSGRADIIVSALSITPQREQLISFSLPYSSISLVIGAPKQLNINGYSDLRGKKVGVGRNTSDGALLKQRSTGVDILEYEDERRLIEAFLKRQFDIISCQNATLQEISNMAPDRRLETKFVQQEFQVGMGIRKSEPALRRLINDWVSSNLSNGRLNEIFRRHHGHDLPESVLPKPIIRP